MILLRPPEIITTLSLQFQTQFCSWLQVTKLKETAGWKRTESNAMRKTGYKQKIIRKTPEAARRSSWMRNIWLQAGQNHTTRESKLLKSLVKREREHVWRVNFKKSLEMVVIGPMEIDRPFQKNQDFRKNTHLKTSLHNTYCEQGNKFEYFLMSSPPSFKQDPRNFFLTGIKHG